MVVGSLIIGKMIWRIFEGFVIKGDSIKLEIIRCCGIVLRSWVVVIMEGRDGNIVCFFLVREYEWSCF